MNTAFTEFLAAVMPLLLQFLAAIVGLFLARAAHVARARWGIEIEEVHREALHSALMSGIRAALLRGLRGNAAVSAAIHHASRSVPDALAALHPGEGVLISIAESKLREALEQTPFFGVDVAPMPGAAAK